MHDDSREPTECRCPKVGISLELVVREAHSYARSDAQLLQKWTVGFDVGFKHPGCLLLSVLVRRLPVHGVRCARLAVDLSTRRALGQASQQLLHGNRPQLGRSWSTPCTRCPWHL